MDVAAELVKTKSARLAAGWTAGIVMVAGAAFATATGNDEIGFVVFFGVGGLGIAWYLWLDDRVTKLEAAQTQAGGPTLRVQPAVKPPGEPPPPPPSAAADPTVVVAVIGLASAALGVLGQLMK